MVHRWAMIFLIMSVIAALFGYGNFFEGSGAHASRMLMWLFAFLALVSCYLLYRDRK